MNSAPEDLLGLRREGNRGGFYNEAWRQTFIELDTFLYRLRVMATASWREKPSATWVQCRNAPVLRYEGPNVVIDGKLHIFGGFSGFEIQALTRTEIYDPVEDRWSSGPALPQPITHLTPEIADGHVWMVGGFYGDHPGPTTDLVFSYEIGSGEWHERPPLPRKTAAAMVILVNRELHCMGGFEDRFTATADHWALSLDEPGQWRQRAPMDHARGHHSAVAIDGRIYVCGGQFGHDKDPFDLDVVEVYDPKTDQWSSRAPLPRPRSHSETSTLVRNGRIVILGGLDRSAGLRIRGLPNITSYDPVKDNWEELAPMPVGLIAPGAKVIGDYLYVTGGADLLRPGTARAGTLRADVSVLDPPE